MYLQKIFTIVCFPSGLGPRYHDKGKSYAPGPFVGPPCEPSRLPSQGWRFPPRSMNHHRDPFSFRPPFEDAIPVAGRGSFCVLFILMSSC